MDQIELAFATNVFDIVARRIELDGNKISSREQWPFTKLLSEHPAKQLLVVWPETGERVILIRTPLGIVAAAHVISRSKSKKFILNLPPCVTQFAFCNKSYPVSSFMLAEVVGDGPDFKDIGDKLTEEMHHIEFMSDNKDEEVRIKENVRAYCIGQHFLSSSTMKDYEKKEVIGAIHTAMVTGQQEALTHGLRCTLETALNLTPDGLDAQVKECTDGYELIDIDLRMNRLARRVTVAMFSPDKGDLIYKHYYKQVGYKTSESVDSMPAPL